MVPPAIDLVYPHKTIAGGPNLGTFDHSTTTTALQCLFSDHKGLYRAQSPSARRSGAAAAAAANNNSCPSFTAVTAASGSSCSSSSNSQQQQQQQPQFLAQPGNPVRKDSKERFQFFKNAAIGRLSKGIFQ